MYEVIPDLQVLDQVAAMPTQAQAAFLEVLDALEVAPWSGAPQHVANPDGPVRYWVFGEDQAGQVVHLVLEDQREVHLLLVQWLD